MEKITFLGPIGATFSHDAYNLLARSFAGPKVVDKGGESNYISANSNGEILPLILKHSGFGAIAMETRAEGRVAEPLESFIDLLNIYKNIEDCPFRIVGAVRMKLSFCLLARPGLMRQALTGVVAHPKALGACKNNLDLLGLATTNAPSNGEAARLVAQNEQFASYAALGPRSASEKYKLSVLDGAFEDTEAVTTFFMMAPQLHRVSVGEANRVLIVFKVPHKPGALVKSLLPFEEEGLNLIQVHSVHAGNALYHFAIEVEVGGHELPALRKAREKFERHVDEHIFFGPFEVISK